MAQSYNSCVAQAGRIIKRIVVVTYLVLVHVAAGFFLYQTFFPNGISSLRGRSVPISDPQVKTDVPTPLPVPSQFADQANKEIPDPGNNQFPPQTEAVTSPPVHESPSGLLIPVAGIRPEQLSDTFNSSRSENRVHDAIDIMAPAGTPVVAVADGTIIKFFDSQRGGITIYQISSDQKYFYYYAHLQRRAENVREGDPVKKGTVIAYVGDTGNSGAGNFHLHFAISIVRDPKRFWDGQPINPYPLLRGNP